MQAAKAKTRLGFLLAGILASLCVSATLEITPLVLEKIQQKYGPAAEQRVREWQDLLANAQALTEPEKLALVNTFFNERILFTDDELLWGVRDYWATPLEFLAQGAGDCEDYSIAKYFTLKELGMAEDKMRLTYVKALNLNQAHMVLTYYPNPRAMPLVLDNLIPTIERADKRRDLLPVYSFNGLGLWLAKQRGHDRRVGDSDRLSLWMQLKQRMLEQPF